MINLALHLDDEDSLSRCRTVTEKDDDGDIRITFHTEHLVGGMVEHVERVNVYLSPELARKLYIQIKEAMQLEEVD